MNCSIPGCTFSRTSKLRRGLCSYHYSIWKRLPNGENSLDHVLIVAKGREIMHGRNAAERLRPKHEKMSRADYIANCRASHRRWYYSNKETAFALVHKRRAQLQGSWGSYTEDDILGLMIKQRLRCKLCNEIIASKFHRDHIVPISKGGSNDISNIQLLCPHCNLSKHDKI